MPFRFVDPFEGKAGQAANVLAVHSVILFD